MSWTILDLAVHRRFMIDVVKPFISFMEHLTSAVVKHRGLGSDCSVSLASGAVLSEKPRRRSSLVESHRGQHRCTVHDLCLGLTGCKTFSAALGHIFCQMPSTSRIRVFDQETVAVHRTGPDLWNPGLENMEVGARIRTLPCMQLGQMRNIGSTHVSYSQCYG